jgi:hypothetical protein
MTSERQAFTLKSHLDYQWYRESAQSQVHSACVVRIVRGATVAVQRGNGRVLSRLILPPGGDPNARGVFAAGPERCGKRTSDLECAAMAYPTLRKSGAGRGQLTPAYTDRMRSRLERQAHNKFTALAQAGTDCCHVASMRLQNCTHQGETDAKTGA